MFTNIWKIMKENKFETENKISKKFICSICNELMIKACSAPCGCRFCSDCIENYLDGSDKFCPGKSKYCQNKMINYANEISADNVINIKISEIIVKCPIKNCEFRDELNIIDNHMKTCSKRPITCPYHGIGCERNEVMAEEIKDHLINDGSFHSKLLIELINNLSSKNESMQCEIIELKIENNQLKQKLDNFELQLTTHQNEICDLKIKDMKNVSKIVTLNNENQSMRKDIEKHMESINEMKRMIKIIQTQSLQQIDEFKINYHRQKLENEEVEMMRNTINDICKQNAKFSSRIDNLDETFKQINDEKINILSIKIMEIETKLENELNQEIIASKNEIRLMKSEFKKNVESINQIRETTVTIQTQSQLQTQQIDKFKQNQKKQEEANKKVDRIKKYIDKIYNQNSNYINRLNNRDRKFKEITDIKINKLEIKMIKMETQLENEEVYRNFEWKIENVSQKKKDVRIFSNPFYSGKSGYKMCLSAIIVQYFDVINVDFHLMRGEYDDKLIWPFKYIVTVDLVDGENENIYKSEIRKYSFRPDRDGWNKPSDAINHKIWFFNVPIDSSAVKNDQIIYKCRVEKQK